MDDWDPEDFDFYATLTRHHPLLYRQACDQQCTICIPPNGTVPADAAAFLKAHLLHPSKEFLGAWTDFEGETQVHQDGVWLCAGAVSGTSDGPRVRVLRTDTQYNDRQQPFRILYLQRPLSGAPGGTGGAGASHWPASLPELMSHFHRHATPDIRAHLDLLIAQFISNYQIIDRYEHLLAEKVASMVAAGMADLSAAAPKVAENRRAWTIGYLAVHSHLLGGIHDKIFGHFRRVNADKDHLLQEFQRELRSEGVQIYGLPPAFRGAYSASVMLLGHLAEPRSVYLKLHVLSKVLDSVAEEAAVSVANEEITADVVVPLLAHAVCRSQCPDLHATLQYVTVLCPEVLRQTEMSYARTSFEAALHFVMDEGYRRTEDGVPPLANRPTGSRTGASGGPPPAPPTAVLPTEVIASVPADGEALSVKTQAAPRSTAPPPSRQLGGFLSSLMAKNTGV